MIFIVFVFVLYTDVYFEYTQRYKKMTIKELKDFIFENYYRQIGFTKENSYYLVKYQKEKDLLLLATKLIEKIPDASNAKEYYQSFLKNKNKTLVKL